jgi:hypothetical protein
MKAKLFPLFGIIVLTLIMFGLYQNCGSPSGGGSSQLEIGSHDEDPGDPPINIAPLPAPSPVPPTGTKACTATVEVLGKWNGSGYPAIALSSPPIQWLVNNIDECKAAITAYVRPKLCDTGVAGSPLQVVWWRTGNSNTTSRIPFTFDGVVQNRLQECSFTCNGAQELTWGGCADPHSMSQ